MFGASAIGMPDLMDYRSLTRGERLALCLVLSGVLGWLSSIHTLNAMVLSVSCFDSNRSFQMNESNSTI